MDKLTLFYLADCPYCHHARRAIKELIKKNPDYASIDIEWIEESRHPEISDRYNYYYVPTIFKGKEKLYEAHPSESYDDIMKKIRDVLDGVL